MHSRLITTTSLMIGALSAAGLAALVVYVPPTTASTALALLLLCLTTFGISGPVWGAILRKMTPKTDARKVMVMGMRFGLWSGIFITSLVLLKILNFMDRVLILAIVALLIMIEMFFQQTATQKHSSRKSRR